jgi:hypothetical protein
MHLNSWVKTFLLHKINYASNTGDQEYNILPVLQGRVCRSDIISVLPKRLHAYVVTVMYGVITYEYSVSRYLPPKGSVETCHLKSSKELVTSSCLKEILCYQNMCEGESKCKLNLPVEALKLMHCKILHFT